jgi:hypothetical protein
MKKFILTLVALVAGTSAFANGPLTIKLDNIQGKTVSKKTEGPAFSSQSFAGAPVLNHNGQLVGLDVVVLVDKYEENLAVVRPLAEYSVVGVKVRSVAAVSVSPNGKQVYAGLGVLVPVGKVLDGLDLEVGAVAPGADLTNGFKVDGNFVPAVKAKIDLSKVFGGAKKVVNEGMKKLSPVGGRI